MKLLTESQRRKLLANGLRRKTDVDFDPHPVIMIFTPDAGATWLLTELDPDEPARAFGLADLGFGCPELGYVDLRELATVRGKLGLSIERDLYFRPGGTITAYAENARLRGHLIT
jgi:hypothetical protein